MSSIDEFLATLSPETRKRAKLADEIVTRRLPVPSFAMNVALQGGIGHGHQTLLWGAKSAGKSSFAMQMMGGAQREGLICGYVDVEGTLDRDWVKRLGVNTKELVYLNEKAADQMADRAVDVMRKGIDVLVVDSISALAPASYYEKGELKNMENTRQIGSESKDAATYCRLFNLANEKTALVLISQMRTQINPTHAAMIPTGGQAPQFYSSTIIKLLSSNAKGAAIKGFVNAGDRVFERDIARKVEWRVEFNKLGPQNRVGEYNFHYDGDFVGIDNIGETVSLAIEYGIIDNTAKGRFEYNGTKFHGEASIARELRANAVLLEKVQGELSERL